VSMSLVWTVLDALAVIGDPVTYLISPPIYNDQRCYCLMTGATDPIACWKDKSLVLVSPSIKIGADQPVVDCSTIVRPACCLTVLVAQLPMPDCHDRTAFPLLKPCSIDKKVFAATCLLTLPVDCLRLLHRSDLETTPEQSEFRLRLPVSRPGRAI
jgi:hypothetical protein